VTVAEKIKTALPPDLDLGGNWIVEWDAVDPVTGDSVAGVSVSDTSLLIVQLGGAPLDSGTFKLVPGPGA
jgi:hypothetical protein